MNLLSVNTFLFSILPLVFPKTKIDSLLENLSKRPPTENGTTALDVRLGMYLESVGNFRSTEMSFDVDLYVYMSWRDPRLSHNHSDHVLVNDDEIRKQLWLPDLYFANAREAHFQEVTMPNFNMFIAPDGTIAYSCRCTLTVACSLDLRFYPMDLQVCSIRVLSYAYIARQMNVSWFSSNPIRHNPEIGLPEFVITNVEKGYCNGTYRYALMPGSFKIDEFSCLAGKMYLARSIGYNLVQSYIPTGLIVMISWVSFWIDRRAVPARVTLSFTTLVSLTTLGNGLRFGLPQVSYAKAIDLWYGACMLFVFCALLEFAIINSYMRKAEKFDQIAKRAQNILQGRRTRANRMDIPKLDASQLDDMLDERRSNGFNYIDETVRDEVTPSSYRLLKRNKIKSSPRFPEHLRAEYKLTAFPVNGDMRAPDTGMGESIESAPRSVYDNVSPSWKDLKKSLLADDSSKESVSDDDIWEMMPKMRASVVYGFQGSRKISVDPAAAYTYAQISKRCSRQALRIDKMCRYGFPFVFLAWNIWYWWYYLVYNRAFCPDNTECDNNHF
ncbi:unnamed protein product [Auanema sp. JU1783]|nr:unnamed protein product [Auanema sp. JU1783]